MVKQSLGETMDETLFSELLASANEALEHAQGKRNLRTTILPPPPEPMDAREVQKLRARLEASQPVFASYLNVSTKLVQAWEANRRTPDGAALRLLRLAEKAPELLLSGTHPSRKRTRTTSTRTKASRTKVR
jgi:putative transcriptional regulator